MQNIFIKKFSGIILLFMIIVSPCLAETSGEDLYYRGSYMDAEEYFREMDMNHPKDVRWRYNRGCAAFKSDQMEASLSAFNSVTKRTKDPELLFRASYNAGNILFKKGDFASASQFYLQALKIKPDDEDARYNLALSLAKKKEAQQQDNKSQCDNPKQGDQNQNSQKQDSQQKQQNKDDTQQDKQAKNKDSQKQEGEQQNKQQSKESEDKKESQQTAQKDNKQEEKPDMSQELKAAQAMPEDQKDQQEQSPEEKAQKMAVLKAEALLDNIQENRSIQMKQMASEGKEDARSGKHW